MSWWDYGYQAAFMTNRTTIVDNNTWNNTHIANVGLAMGSPEEIAYPILQHLDVDYVFVVFGGVSHQQGDDLNKFLWMVRIASGEYPGIAKGEASFLAPSGHYPVGSEAAPALKESIMYRMSYTNFHNNTLTRGYDQVRKSQIDEAVIPLEHLEEVYTTSSWLVRIFRVKPPKERLPFGKTPLTNVLLDNPR